MEIQGFRHHRLMQTVLEVVLNIETKLHPLFTRNPTPPPPPASSQTYRHLVATAEPQNHLHAPHWEFRRTRAVCPEPQTNSALDAELEHVAFQLSDLPSYHQTTLHYKISPDRTHVATGGSMYLQLEWEILLFV